MGEMKNKAHVPPTVTAVEAASFKNSVRRTFHRFHREFYQSQDFGDDTVVTTFGNNIYV